MWETLPNNAHWDFFKTPILQEILRIQNLLGVLCVVGSQTLFPISWMCEEQTSVSHSSTESDIISLDAGLRLDGFPALDLWDLIIAVLGNTNWNRIERRDLLMNKREVRSTPHTLQNGSDLEECSVFWTMLTLFPQTSNLHIRKLCCMCFQTTKQ